MVRTYEDAGVSQDDKAAHIAALVSVLRYRRKGLGNPLTKIGHFTGLVDFGYVRILMHRPTGFVLSLVRHDGAAGGRFSELNTGVDHIGLTAGSRDELLAWEERFRSAGVVFTPVRDMAFGYHLNFRDPDGIALEFSVANELYESCLQELRDRDVPRAEIQARVEEMLGISVGA